MNDIVTGFNLYIGVLLGKLSVVAVMFLIIVILCYIFTDDKKGDRESE